MPLTPEQVITAAWRFTCRRPGVRQKQGVMHLLASESPARVRLLAPDPKSSTAAWRFNTKNNRHEIVVGTKFDEQITVAPPSGAVDEARRKFVIALLEHEAAHGRFTERDMNGVAALLISKKLPFRLLNLFEDARIEHLHRTSPAKIAVTGPRGFRFRWTEFGASPASTDDPARFIWALVNNEQSATKGDVGPRWTGSSVTKHGLPTRPRLRWYYDQAVAAANTKALLPLVEQFVNEFGVPNPVPRGSDEVGGVTDPSSLTGSGGSGFGGGSAIVPSDEEAVRNCNEFPPELTTGKNPTEEEVKDLSYFGSKVAQDRYPPHRKGIVEHGSKRAVVKNIESRLLSLMHNAGQLPVRVGETGSRLHMPAACVGREDSFRNVKAASGVRTITVIFDASGSMHGQREAEAKSFLFALVQLHRKGVLNTRIWLSGKGRRVKVNPWWNMEALASVVFFQDSEGIAGTLATPRCRQDIAESSAVFIYTDAQLTDGDVDAKGWRQRGVDLVGCTTWCDEGVPGPHRDTITAGMKQHFARHLIGNNPVDLAGQIVSYAVGRGAH